MILLIHSICVICAEQSPRHTLKSNPVDGIQIAFQVPRAALESGHAQLIILLVGVLSSIALILGGLAWHFTRTGELGIQYGIIDMKVAERNWKYTAFTAFVLTILTYRLFLR